MNKLKNLIIGMALFVSAFAPALVPVTVHAATAADSVCAGTNLNLSSKDSKCETNNADKKLEELLRRIIRILQIVVGFIALIMVIIGGFKYVMSGGDSGDISGAKNTILYAIVGLVIVVFAEVLVQFVVNRISDV